MAFEQGSQPLQPLQLVLELGRVRGASLGDVGVHHRDAPDDSPDQARLVRFATVVEAVSHLLRLLAADDGHASICLLPPEDDVITCFQKGHRRKVGILHLRLLEAEDVGILFL